MESSSKPGSSKLIRQGDNLLLVLDKSLLETLHIDENTPLSVVSDGQRIIVEPADKDRDEHLRAELEEADREYNQMFKGRISATSADACGDSVAADAGLNPEGS